MTNDPLGTYLTDHLAGSESACRMLERLRDRFDPESGSGLFAELLAEVRADQEVLQRLMDRVGTGAGAKMKTTAAKIVETLSRPKLDLDSDSGDTLGLFEALEVLSLGVLGKRALWRALARIVDQDPRISGVDYEDLERRATQQFERIERRRLAEAPQALSDPES